MRSILTLIISIAWISTFAQEAVSSKRKSIDADVQKIRNDKTPRPVTFSIQADKKVLHSISYNYISGADGYVRIKRQFSLNNDSIRQTFYLKKGQLIFANEQIITYHTGNNKTDSIGWSGDFYFSNGKLIYFETLGHGKSEDESWNPEQNMLSAFNDSVNDITRHKKKKNGS